MKIIQAIQAAALAVLIVAGSWSPAYAAAKGSKTSASSSKTVAVRTYTRKDGTTVAGHMRAASHARETAPAPTPTTSSHAQASVARTADGRIARSETAKRQFERRPAKGRVGRGRSHPPAPAQADAPSNMQRRLLRKKDRPNAWVVDSRRKMVNVRVTPKLRSTAKGRALALVVEHQHRKS